MPALRLSLPLLGVLLWAAAGAAQELGPLPPLLPPGQDAERRSSSPPMVSFGDEDTGASDTAPALSPGVAGESSDRPASRFAREASAKAAAEREEPPPRVLPDVVAVPGLGGAFGECPRELLRLLLGGATERRDALSAVALETELLVLCRERQELVNAVVKLELEIAELIAPSPVAAEPVAEEPPVVVIADLAAGPDEGGLRLVAEKEAEPPPEPEPTAASYAWFSIIGMPGRLMAGVSDGEDVWFVREGDALPGDVEVGMISSRPPGVEVFGEDQPVMLPYGPRPLEP